MPLYWLLGIVVAILAILSFVFLAKSGGKTSLLEFNAKALREGFTIMEAGRLREAAKASGIADQGEIFESTRDLDRVIATIGGVDIERSREVTRLLDKLYELRKRLEFEQPRYNMGITSSRRLYNGQRLRLLIQGLGVYHCTIIDNNPRFLVVSYPNGVRPPAGFVWKGKRVSVYFWRRDDAGYVFDSFVIDDLRIRDVPVLHISHSESLLRTQKRRSIRARTSLPAQLYLLKRIEGAFEKPEQSPGYRSRLTDLSEDGFALVIGGQAKPGLLVKTQFAINSRQVVMSGTVKSVDYDQSSNQSTLHVQSVPPSPRTLNAIRSYIYGSRARASREAESGDGA